MLTFSLINKFRVPLTLTPKPVVLRRLLDMSRGDDAYSTPSLKVGRRPVVPFFGGFDVAQEHEEK